jgi:2',3'-cyclic-nucleotide 2'-phosphodiesterase (5'-nucleotidase family)/predicted AlkP superfamily phosphohydrolase/phosphomutase
MRRWIRWLAPALLGAAALTLTITAGSAVAWDNHYKPVDRVVMFASDGMRPDLMEKYAEKGFMPTYKKLMNRGAFGKNGMVQAFPPNTGVGWYTMATGTYPSEHGSTNNTFFRSGDNFANRTSFSGAGALQADTIANAAERAGKKVAQIDWVGGIPANINGPTVDFATFYSNRGVLVGAADPVEQAGAATFGVNYQVGAIAAASGWSGVPAGDPAAPAKESTWSIPTSFAPQNPNRTYNVYFYDGVVNGTAAYDHAIVSPVGKTGASPSVNLAIGDFEPVKLTGADGLIGTRATETVGHYIKLISLSSDLSQFKLYATSLARAAAKCGTACAGLPAGIAGEDRLEKYIADNLLPWSAADFAPEEAGVIDEDTYVEQGRDLERAYSLQVINYVLGTLQPDTDLAMVGYPFTDEVSHQFMGLVTKTDADGDPNPCYDVNPKFDDVACTGSGTANRVAIREGYIRSAYQDADEKLGITRELMGGNPTTFAGSDHGFGAQWLALNANKVLNAATVHNTATNTDVSLHASNANAANCGAATTDLTKACWAGGTIQVYVNTTLPAGITYEAVRTAVRNAFAAVTDPANPGKQVILKIMNKEELRNVDGSDSLHPNRSGDVVVVTRPPYQSDAGTNNVAVALSHFFGQHGYLPDYVDLKNNINMHAVFVMSGPGVEHERNVKGIRAIDVAPTLSFLMGIPGPQNARGRILYPILSGVDETIEVTILDISDWHAQLTPLAEASDNLAAPAVNPTFGIAGAAFLKTWFDTYEAEAALSNVGPHGEPDVVEVAGGDSFGGATPPISNFFGDKPTPPIMNMMGIDADAIGNHSFDHGQTYLRNELIPLADFPMVSSNVVFPNGKTPAEWSPSTVIKLSHGIKLGIVGFTTESTPGIVFPGNLDPFQVRPVVPAVNAEAAKLRKKMDIVLALGHEGATGGTIDQPTGPLADIADQVTNVDAVIGDHNDLQVDSLRSNGVLVTENRGKGIRFTRMRIVVDPKLGVIYKTADFHKPWNIGLTPDPAIQAKINELNAQLAPILGVQIGSATKPIPRADQCGGGTGRTCESLIGDVVTDAMRTAYTGIGVQFAITNSGGIRADLTCPNPDLAGDFCPSFTPPPFPITRGQSLAVLPFGNIVVTLSVNGAELKTMLENGVSQMPAVDGRFPQVSGLCFTYDIASPAGSRVKSAVTTDTSGNCTATPVDLTAATTYKIAENDFMATGGDGYPNFASRMTTQDIMEQVQADYITANSPLTPTVKAFPNGRVNCDDSNGATGPNCPTLVPSP